MSVWPLAWESALGRGQHPLVNEMLIDAHLLKMRLKLSDISSTSKQSLTKMQESKDCG